MAKEKQVAQLLNETSLDDSFIMGYYGGGNFGDELLFEVLQHTFRQHDYQNIYFLYQKPDKYSLFHHDLGYELVDSANRIDVLKAVWQRKTLVIGGGGLWGLDVNVNVILMSVMLFIARTFMGKNVYLLGVGYYGSTGRLGHIGAWLAGKSATQILARDEESYQRFSKINSQVFLCDDMAFSLPKLDSIDVDTQLNVFEEHLGPIDDSTIFVSVRRFKPNQPNSYQKAIATWLASSPDRPVIMALMEPRTVDPEGYALLKRWQWKYPHMKVIDFDYNPVVLYRFFEKYHSKLSYIGPQFHVLLVAHLARVRLLPIAYDNKVSALFEKLKYESVIPIREVSAQHVLRFVSERQDASI